MGEQTPVLLQPCQVDLFISAGLRYGCNFQFSGHPRDYRRTIVMEIRPPTRLQIYDCHGRPERDTTAHDQQGRHAGWLAGWFQVGERMYYSNKRARPDCEMSDWSGRRSETARRRSCRAVTAGTAWSCPAPTRPVERTGRARTRRPTPVPGGSRRVWPPDGRHEFVDAGPQRRIGSLEEPHRNDVPPCRGRVRFPPRRLPPSRREAGGTPLCGRSRSEIASATPRPGRTGSYL